MRYAIPSRGRAETLAKRTLPTLDRLQVVPEEITVFVAEEEWDAYAAALRGTGVTLSTGALGVAAQRNAILDTYPPGKQLVSIDDDIYDVLIRRDEKVLEPITPEAWHEAVESAFRWCQRLGARIWGVYPTLNPLFMRDRVRADLTYICANLYGFITPGDDPDSPLRVSMEDKEDFERSLQCYDADRAVVRLEWVSTKTRYYDEPGGMQTDGLRTEERIRANAEELCRRYPQWAKLNLTKRSGHAEVRLRDPAVGTVTMPR
jgi:hypothetical protein